MTKRIYSDLPSVELKPDDSFYRMMPALRKQANAMLRRECCSYDDGNCLELDDGDTHTCPQLLSGAVCCKWLPHSETLEAEVFRDRDTKRCTLCGAAFVPGSNRAKYCPDCAAKVHRRQKAESERKRRSVVDN